MIPRTTQQIALLTVLAIMLHAPTLAAQHSPPQTLISFVGNFQLDAAQVQDAQLNVTRDGNISPPLPPPSAPTWPTQNESINSLTLRVTMILKRLMLIWS